MSISYKQDTHWYDCKDGDYKPKHGAGLMVARKELLYPSPTSIEKSEFVNIWLDRWKMDELALAAAENPKQIHEDDDAYCQRIYEISLEKSIVAARFGSEIHQAIEDCPQMPLDSKLLPYFDKFSPWFINNVGEVRGKEKILVDHDLGVAGRTDLIGVICGKLTVEDTKTQKIKPDKKGRSIPKFYDSWCRQLSFYAVSYAKEVGMFPDIPECISVVINSAEPMEPFVKVWSREEVLYAYTTFVCACYHWFSSRDYWPQRNGPFAPTFSIPMPK